MRTLPRSRRRARRAAPRRSCRLRPRRSRAGPGSRAAGGRPSPRGSRRCPVPSATCPSWAGPRRSGSGTHRIPRSVHKVTKCRTEVGTGPARAQVASDRVMVAGLAFVATAVATLFAQATLVRFTRDRRPHGGVDDRARAVRPRLGRPGDRRRRPAGTTARSGSSTCSARSSNVPWLALGTVYLLAGRRPRPAGRSGASCSSPASRRASCSTAPMQPGRGHARSRSARTCSACSPGCSRPSAAASARS